MVNILLVGCGKMGGAMLDGWVRQGRPSSSIAVIEPTESIATTLQQKYGVAVYTKRQDIHPNFIPDVVIFAIKPQIAQDVVPAYAGLGHKDTLFITIAAGKTLATFAKYLGMGKAIVRGMPNLPATIGKGVTVACMNHHVTYAQKKWCIDLLSANGHLYWIEDESHLDAVTAISGSGPAYIFYLIECLAACGIDLGLPEDLAQSLSYLTVEGSSALASQSDIGATELRRQVTSPQGTTQAALDILMAPDGLMPLLEETTKAAYERSKELAD